MLEDSAYAALCSAVTLQSDAKGFFRTVADGIVESAGAEWLRHFGRLESNEQRIAECLTDKRVKRLVREMTDNVREVYRGKSATISKRARLEADTLYKSGETDRALLALTRSVVKAPSAESSETGENGPDLALALWTRSTIFYEREKTLLCLEDVKLSLREKLPDNLRIEAYRRMAECYISLRRFDEARITLDILSRMTEKGDDLRSKLNDSMTATVSESEDGTNTVGAIRSLKERTLTLSGGEHARIKRVSSKLELAETNEAGRFFVAAESIRTGDTLVVEDAYVSCLAVERYCSHCHHCTRRLETAIPCPDCSAIAFCSLACRTRALGSYHKYECRYADLLIGSGMSILCFAALRIVSQQSVAYFENANWRENEKYDGDHPYRRVYDMARHEKKRSAEDFFRRALMAIFLLSVLKKSGYFGSTRDNHIGRRETAIGAVLLRNIEALQFNAHEISETVSSGDSVKMSNIGVGLYASASYFNHECFPATTRFFRGTTLIAKATRPLRQGEVVSECYGPMFGKFDTIERRRRLRARYLFECECTACVRDWPLPPVPDEARRYPPIRCYGCETAIDDGPTTSEGKSTIRCEKCDTSDEYENDEALSADIERLRTRLEIPAQNLTPEAAAKIGRLLDALDKRIRPPHTIYRLVADKLTPYWSLSFSLIRRPNN